MALFGDLAALFSANPIPVAVAAGVLVTIVSALLIAVVVYIIIKCKQRKERDAEAGEAEEEKSDVEVGGEAGAPASNRWSVGTEKSMHSADKAKARKKMAAARRKNSHATAHVVVAAVSLENSDTVDHRGVEMSKAASTQGASSAQFPRSKQKRRASRAGGSMGLSPTSGSRWSVGAIKSMKAIGKAEARKRKANARRKNSATNTSRDAPGAPAEEPLAIDLSLAPAVPPAGTGTGDGSGATTGYTSRWSMGTMKSKKAAKNVARKLKANARRAALRRAAASAAADDSIDLSLAPADDAAAKRPTRGSRSRRKPTDESETRHVPRPQSVWRKKKAAATEKARSGSAIAF